MSEPLELPAPPAPPSPADASLGLTRVRAVLEVLLCSGIPTQLLLGIALRAVGLQPRSASGDLSFSFVVALSLTDAVVLIALMVLITRAHGESPAELWLGGKSLAREALFGILLIPVVFLVVATLLGAVRFYAPGLHNVETNPLEQLAATSTTNAVIFGLVAIIAGGVREELQRAFLLRRFEQHLGGATVGVVVLGIAFGLLHSLQGWDAVIATGTLGVLWAIVYVRRRSAVAPIVSHAAFNSLEILFMRSI